MSTVSGFETVLQNEKYMNDVASAIFAQLKEKARRKICDPLQAYDNVPQTDAFIAKSEVQKQNLMIKRENVKTRIHDDCTLQNHIDTEKQNTSKANRINKIVQLSGSKKRMSESENGAMEIYCEKQACKADTNDFQGFCRRNSEFGVNKSYTEEQSISNSFPYSDELNKKINSLKIVPSSQEYSKNKSITSRAIKDITTKNKLDEKLGHCHKTEHLATSALIKKKFPCAKKKIYLCIKLAGMKSDKNFELISELSDFIRVKNTFPKLFEIIPDIDSECKKIAYSLEAVNIIFRFVFNNSLSLSAISSPIISIEVLAATQFWEIDKFHEIFKKLFLQKTLTPNNVSSIFSYACHYGLKEVCDACKNIRSDITDLALKKLKRSCFLTISTYVEPSEFSIPFYPLEKSFPTSFERHVQNKIVFKGISGTYVIKGIQVQLNKNHLLESNGNKLNVKKDLEIDCSIRNTSNNQKLNQIEKKSVRPINIIYFKETLIVKPGEVGEITVETDTLPYLCSGSLKSEREEKISTGEFELRIHSFSPIKCSDEKMFLFVIGKLFYVKS